MGVGSHLNDYLAGSAPKSTMYWFEGILVHLVSRLDKPGVVPESVARVVDCARASPSRQPIDAVLISIAHIVLVRVFSSGKVQHTNPIPLFIFRDQPSQGPRERFSQSKLQKISQRKEEFELKKEARLERQTRGEDVDDCDSEIDEEIDESISSDLPEAMDLIQTYREITKTEPTFFALALFLDPATRPPVPLSASARGCFPTEIYRLIIEYVEDAETHGACMAISSEFQEMCLRNSRIDEGWKLLPNEATMTYTRAHRVWNEEQPPERPEHVIRWRKLNQYEPSLMPGIRVLELATGLERDVTIDRVRSSRRNSICGNIWRVVVGKIRHRRSLLLDMDLCLRDIERHLLG